MLYWLHILSMHISSPCRIRTSATVTFLPAVAMQTMYTCKAGTSCLMTFVSPSATSTSNQKRKHMRTIDFTSFGQEPTKKTALANTNLLHPTPQVLGQQEKRITIFLGKMSRSISSQKQTSSASLSFLSQLTVFVKSIGPNLSSRWKSPYFFWWSYSFHQHIIHINPSLPKKCGILGLRQHNAKVVLSDRWHACRWMAESNWDNDFQHVSKTHSLDISWILFGQKACKSSAFTSIRCFRLLFVLIQVWLESTQTASRICSALFRSKAPWPWRAWSKC